MDLPFVYILGVVVTVLILAFGLKAITDIKKTSETVEIATFITDLNRVVETYYNLNVGSSKQLSLQVPKPINMICFTAPKKEQTADVPQEIAFLLQGRDNVYIFNSNIGPRLIPHLEPSLDENPLCFQTQGRLKADIETKVRERSVFVEISR